MKNLVYKSALHIYALLPASIQFAARRTYHRFRPSVPARDAAQIWATYLQNDLFETVKRNFDHHFYARTYQVSEDTAWDHYLAVGIPSGNCINSEHSAATTPVVVDSKMSTSEYQFEIHDAEGRNLISIDTIPGVIKNPDLLTLDLWDTLIRRNRPADASKLATARRLLIELWGLGLGQDLSAWDLFKLRVQTEAEIARGNSAQEYEIEEVLQATIAKLNFDIDERAIANELFIIEVEEEIRWSEAILEVEQLAKSIKAKSTVIASDFYFVSSALERIVREHLPKLEFSKVYSSCEVQASKRLDGKLFELIRKDHDVEATNHIHIGDNLHSDVKNHLRHNGRAIAVHAELQKHVAPGEYGPATLSFSFQQLDELVESLEAKSPAFKSGQRAAIFAVALVAGAVETAIKHGLSAVHYCSREGAFLQRVHNEVVGTLFPNKVIEGRHVTVSRRATFGPSLHLDSAEKFYEDLQRMWSMYGSQSPKAFLVSLGLNIENYQESLKSHGFEIESPVIGIGSNEEFQSWVLSPDVINQVVSELKTNRAILKTYLDEALLIENESLVIADIGWRGTIQDNLGRICDTSTFHGVYLGLFPFLNEQNSLHTKQAVVFDGNKGEKYFYAEPPAAIERPWTPHIPSVVKFISGNDGKPLAVTEIEDDSVSSSVVDFQEGSLDTSETVASWLIAHGLTSEMIRTQLQERLENYYQEPDTAVAGIWFDSSHDDTFGALNQTSFGKFRPDRTWLENPSNEIFENALASSNWPSGYVAWQPIKALLSLAKISKGYN